MKKYFVFGLFCFLSEMILLQGCVPHVARTNAKLEEGFDLALSGGPTISAPGTDERNSPTDTRVTAFGELDLQGAMKFKNDSALAVQLKIPASLFFSALDFYLQLPPSGRWYYGFGAEFGWLSGGYGVLTRYLDDDYYVTLTGRFLSEMVATAAGRSLRSTPFAALNGQLAFGKEMELVDASLFVSYARYFGNGINFEVFDESDDDFRKNFVLTGLSFRF